MTTGEKIRKLRKYFILTQTELAAVLNEQSTDCTFTRADIASWENNRHVPNWAKAKVLVRFFGITLDNLIFEDNNAFLQNYRQRPRKRA